MCCFPITFALDNESWMSEEVMWWHPAHCTGSLSTQVDIELLEQLKKHRLFVNVHCTFAVEPFPISWTKWASQVLIKKRRPQRHRTPIVICAKNIKESEPKLWISKKYVVWLNFGGVGQCGQLSMVCNTINVQYAHHQIEHQCWPKSS